MREHCDVRVGTKSLTSLRRWLLRKDLKLMKPGVKVRPTGHELSRIRGEQVQRPWGRSMPGEFRNPMEADLAEVDPAKRREAKDDAERLGGGGGKWEEEALYALPLIQKR